MPIDAALNFTFKNQTYFYQENGWGTGKSSQTWKCGLKFKKLSFGTKRLKMGKWWNQNLCIFEARVRGSIKGCVRFWFWPSNLWTRPNFQQKCSKSAKSNPIFHLKGRGDTVLLLTNLDSPMAEFCFPTSLFSPISAIFRGKKGVKVGVKEHTLDISRFCKNFNFSKIFQTLFLSTWILPVVKISAKSVDIWAC